MNNPVSDLAKKFFPARFQNLTDREKNVLQKIAQRIHISRNTNRQFNDELTFGQHLADRISTFGGSWPFLILFGIVLTVWIALNSVILQHWGKPFDPYPFILLNLVLSMLAAVQAPVIMMSQNRMAAKDRIDAAHDYEVNLKAELEIMELHEKMDGLRHQQWQDLVQLQQEQINMLKELVDKLRPPAAGFGRRTRT